MWQRNIVDNFVIVYNSFRPMTRNFIWIWKYLGEKAHQFTITTIDPYLGGSRALWDLRCSTMYCCQHLVLIARYMVLNVKSTEKARTNFIFWTTSSVINWSNLCASKHILDKSFYVERSEFNELQPLKSHCSNWSVVPSSATCEF